MNIKKELLPDHVAFILDGNRRYARKQGLKPWKGHEEGAEKLEKVLKWLKKAGLKEISIYGFSMQNFKRGEREKKEFFKLAEKYFDKLFKENEDDVNIKFHGRIHLFPESLQEKINEVMEKTKDNTKHYLNICFGYGGREELVDAVKKVAGKVKKDDLDPQEISQEDIEEELYMSSEPDMIIRTGDRKRTSNFLMWQSIYSEWFFLKTLWPAITKEEIANCIREFNDRDRRFGK